MELVLVSMGMRSIGEYTSHSDKSASLISGLSGNKGSKQEGVSPIYTAFNGTAFNGSPPTMLRTGLQGFEPRQVHQKEERLLEWCMAR